MASKYTDTTAIMQVIGCVYNSPQILSFTDKYTITDEDFPDDFHKIALEQFINSMNWVPKKLNWKILQIIYQQDLKAQLSLNSKKAKSGC